MKTQTEKWLKSAIAALVSGSANAFLGVAGISGAQAVGMQIQQFTPKQFGVAVLSGGLVGLFAYLKQSPVPPDSDTKPPFDTKGT